MNKTRKRSFTALLFVLASLFVLALSLGIFSACGSAETLNVGENAGTEESGSTWYYGDKEPAGDLGREGDFYLNTKTLASYVKEGKTWRAAMDGEAGSWYYGTANPNEQLGSEHDFYLNTTTGELYHKSASGWGTAILTLKGTPGRDGVVWFSGNGVPGTFEDAQKGDFYLDYSKFDVYQLGTDGTWNRLGSIKGGKGDDAVDPVQFFNGDGAPDTEENREKLADANEGDLYLGKFDGSDGNGAGSRLYRKVGDDWVVLMETIKENQLDIHSYADLVRFRDSVKINDYEGKEIHLKTDIDFDEAEPASLRRAEARAVENWTPIGTSDKPFRGTFDGEGHKIENFSTQTTESATAVGFFGYVEGATIEHLHFVNAEVTANVAGSVGAVVVGHAAGGITVKDVTVETSTVTAADENAKVGSLVGKAEGTVTVENVTVDAGKTESRPDGGHEDTTLVGDGGENVEFTGENVVEYPIADGFVEKHYKNGEETTVICEIFSIEGLKAFRDSVNGTGDFADKADNYTNKTVKLMTEIDLDNKNWTPIGNASAKAFAGNFDGGKHTISNLYIDADDKKSGWPYVQYLGLFGMIYNKSAALTIKDLTLENVTIKPDVANGAYSPNVGAFIGDGHANGLTLSGLKLEGAVSIRGGSTVGGIAGSLESEDSLTISNVSVNAKNGAITSDAGVGGIVCTIGSPTKSTIMESITVSGVTLDETSDGYGSVGGIVSSVQKDFALNGATLDVTLIPYNSKSITAPNPKAHTYIGAVIGKWTDTCSITGVKGEVTVKGPEGNENPRQPLFYNGGLTGVDTGDKWDTATITGCDGVIVNWYGLSYSLANKTWTVSNVDEMMIFANFVNGGHTFEGETVVLAADIDLKDVANWTPIGNTSAHPFMGAFMGGTVTDGEIVPAVRKISNMTIAKTGDEEGLTEADDKKFAAFFAFTQNAAISNLHFVKANVTNSYTESDGAAGYCAVLVGRTNGGKLEISNVTIGEKPEDTEAGKLAHVQEAPYVTSGKAVAAFVSRSTGGGSITFDNCVNYANLCAPKAAGFIAQFQSSANTPLTIKNSANYGNITMPQSKDVLCDKPDVVMGGFIGYIQSSSEVLLVNCVNEGNIDATITQVKKSVGKLNVGGLISSVHDAAGKTTLVDCINRGNIVINQSLTEGTACDGEIGGLIGSTGAAMYHVEQLGDITVTNTSEQPMCVGGVVGSEDKGVLQMKNRTEYAQIPAPEKGSRAERYDSDEYAGAKPNLDEHSNIVFCDIIVTSPNSTVYLGGATGSGSASDAINSTYVSIYATVNDENIYNKALDESLTLGGMTGATEYTITNSVLHIASSKDRGTESSVVWDAE